MAFSKEELIQIAQVVETIVNKVLDEKLEEKLDKKFAEFKKYVDERFDKIIEKMATKDDIKSINERLAQLEPFKENVLQLEDDYGQIKSSLENEHEARWAITQQNNQDIQKINSYLGLE